MSKNSKKFIKYFVACYGILTLAHIAGISTGYAPLDVGFSAGFATLLIDWV